MNGIVQRATNEKGFGFIKGEDGTEYFFHKQDFIGNFSVMADDVMTGRRVKVQFDSIPSVKGPRASNVCQAP